MKKTLFLSALSLLAVSSLASAGMTRSRETEVDLTTRRATGSVYDTRMSADKVQYIGCLVHGIAGASVGLTCDARDAESERLTCGSTDAGLVSLVLGISDSSFISFTCDANSNLTNLVVNNGSMWLP